MCMWHEQQLILCVLVLSIPSNFFSLLPPDIYKEIWLIIAVMLFKKRTDGTARFVKEAPDTITSWVITAFSLDTFHGLGVIEQPAKVNK